MKKTLKHWWDNFIESMVLKISIPIYILIIIFYLIYMFVDGDGFYGIIKEIRNTGTFAMVGFYCIIWFYKNEKVTRVLTEGKFKDNHQKIELKRKHFEDISSLTNYVKAKYYTRDKQVEDAVRYQLFVFQELFTEEEMKELNQKEQ